jgi:DNA-binding response OmpR family regulator
VGFDALVLDSHGLGSASVNGVRLLRARCTAPIVVLDDGGSEALQLQCLAAGATDVIGRPASPTLIGWKLRQLVQAVAAHRPVSRQELRLGRLRLDPARASARLGSAALALSASEFNTLLVLVARAGQLVSRSELGGPSSSLQCAVGRSIDTRIYRLRRHLERAGAAELELAAVHGRGYRLSLVGPGAAEVEPKVETEGETETEGWTADRGLRVAGARSARDLSERRNWRP